MTRLIPLMIGALFSATMMSSCAGDNPGSGGSVPGANLLPQASVADGWEEVQIDGYPFNLKIDFTGHWESSTNPCIWQPMNGAFDLQLWNSLTSAINEVVKSPASTDERCFTPESASNNTYQSVGMNSIQIKLDNGAIRKVAPKMYTNEVCILMQDRSKFVSMMKQLDAAMLKASREGCPTDRN